MESGWEENIVETDVKMRAQGYCGLPACTRSDIVCLLSLFQLHGINIESAMATAPIPTTQGHTGLSQWPWIQSVRTHTCGERTHCYCWTQTKARDQGWRPRTQEWDLSASLCCITSPSSHANLLTTKNTQTGCWQALRWHSEFKM